jgi:hypothetical protein
MWRSTRQSSLTFVRLYSIVIGAPGGNNERPSFFINRLDSPFHSPRRRKNLLIQTFWYPARRSAPFQTVLVLALMIVRNQFPLKLKISILQTAHPEPCLNMSTVLKPYRRRTHMDRDYSFSIIELSSGDVVKFTVPGYSRYEVSVKQCGILTCIDQGEDGAVMTSASRSSDGDSISFSFGGNLSGTAGSSNLQLFTNASSFVDPFGTLQDSAGGLFSIPVITPAAAPEPSTWALLALGFAGLGYAGHRRSKRGCSRHPA